MKFSEKDVQKLNEDFEQKSAEELLGWAFRQFGTKAPLASSFGVEDIVLIDMGTRFFPDMRVFTLDTGRLPDETYEVIDRVRRKYKIPVEIYFPQTQAVQDLVGKKGLYSFRESVENRKECCAIRKVEPLQRALQGAEAWIAGIRRSQSQSRKDLSKIEIDASQHQILKINPLADWSEERVWNYIREHKAPYNKLYDSGFRSIGCAPCTRALQKGEDIRAGRWWWESASQKECGLHNRNAITGDPSGES